MNESSKQAEKITESQNLPLNWNTWNEGVSKQPTTSNELQAKDKIISTSPLLQAAWGGLNTSTGTLAEAGAAAGAASSAGWAG